MVATAHQNREMLQLRVWLMFSCPLKTSCGSAMSSSSTAFLEKQHIWIYCNTTVHTWFLKTMYFWRGTKRNLTVHHFMLLIFTFYSHFSHFSQFRILKQLAWKIISGFSTCEHKFIHLGAEPTVSKYCSFWEFNPQVSATVSNVHTGLQCPLVGSLWGV